MPPTTSRDFQKAADQRLNAAETLYRNKLNLDAQYIGGYTVECSLKALLLNLTPDLEKPATLAKITSTAKMHKPDVLLGLIREKDPSAVLPGDLARRIRRFRWTTDLRYETGRLDSGETIASLKTAKAIYQWVEGQLP